MVAHTLMVSPVLEQGAVSVSTYLPCVDNWYNYYNFARIGCGWQSLSAPIDVLPINMRGGYIIPHYYASETTKETSKNSMYLLVPLDKNNAAQV